jgi:hypothetical protein
MIMESEEMSSAASGGAGLAASTDFKRRKSRSSQSGERITVRAGSTLTVYRTFSRTDLPWGSWSDSSTGNLRSKPAELAVFATS